MTIHCLPFGFYPGRCVVQGKPQIRFRMLFGKPIHGNILAPKPSSPPFYTPGNVNVVNSREITERTVVNKGGNMPLGLGGKVSEAIT